jgi:hypothetical protein
MFIPHESRIGGVQGVLVHGVSALNLGVVWCRACDAQKILVCNAKVAHIGYWYMRCINYAHWILVHSVEVAHNEYWCTVWKLCALYIGVWCRSCTHWILAYGVNIVHTRYWCAVQNFCALDDYVWYISCAHYILVRGIKFVCNG